MYFEIITNRLILKPLGKKYLQTTIQYAMDYENTKYMCYMPKDTVDETEAFLERIDVEWEKDTPEFYEFAIIFNGCHIGAVSIYFENGLGELGWIINKKYWNNGFAYEAANSLIQYAKNELGVKVRSIELNVLQRCSSAMLSATDLDEASALIYRNSPLHFLPNQNDPHLLNDGLRRRLRDDDGRGLHDRPVRRSGRDDAQQQPRHHQADRRQDGGESGRGNA